MKLIIDIPNYNLDKVQNGSIACGEILKAVKNGKTLPNITDEQISDAFQIAIANYWEEKSKYLTPPPTPAQCPDCSNEISAALEKGEILNIVHKTIYQFFDESDEQPLSDKEKLLLEVNKAICNNLKEYFKEKGEEE